MADILYNKLDIVENGIDVTEELIKEIRHDIKKLWNAIRKNDLEKIEDLTKTITGRLLQIGQIITDCKCTISDIDRFYKMVKEICEKIRKGEITVG